jgi:Resolvase, N terminal domain
MVPRPSPVHRRSCRYPTAGSRHGLIDGEQPPVTFIWKFCRLPPAPPDVVDVDHPLRLASRRRAAPSRFAIPFLRSSLQPDPFVSRQVLTTGAIRQPSTRGHRAARCEGRAYFRILRDPIDTTTAQGMFSLQVLGVVAQLERALIAERTKARLRSTRLRGLVGGNPGLRARDPEPIRKVRAAGASRAARRPSPALPLDGHA